jgi:transcriptional regulator GlxA family with amidase domain
LVRRITEFLDNSVGDLPPLEQIASQFGVSKRHLTRTFSEITGQSILSYVQEVRVERAKELLRHTRLSMIEIAERVGFQSASHFAEIFRRLTQHAPKDWRRSTQSLS